jgi:hypothetical protein
MPLPKPNKSEKQSDFISRCAGNETMNKDFPDQKQRVAVCYSQWKEAKASAVACVGDGDNEVLILNSSKNISIKAIEEEELVEYKNEFLEMALGSIASIKKHAENILAGIQSNPQIKDNLTEPFLQQQLALAEDYMITVHNYVMFAQETDEEGEDEGEMEEEDTDEELDASAEEVNEYNLYIPEEPEYVTLAEVLFDESELEEYDISAKRPGLWENIRKKKQREGKNYRPAKPGDKDRPDKKAWEKAQGSEYQGRKVTLNKPFRTPGGPKKFAVYVKNESGNVVIVRFGDPNMKIKKNIPARRKSFRARHNCENPGPKWKARYWACKSW